MNLFETIESGKTEYNSFALTISNPDEYYEEGEFATRYCILNLNWGGRYWYWKVPEIFKPKKKWVDTSNYSWSSSSGGYWDYIQKKYGFYIHNDYIHTYYGIQPGVWSSKDKENSDHTKLFDIPWRQTYLLYWRYWTPDWKIYDMISIDKKGRLDYSHVQSIQKSVPKVKFRFNDFDGEEIIATCYIEERRDEHGTGWCKWLKYFKKPLISYFLRLEFDKETGYEKGSWKGGTLGHAVEMGFKESPLEAFKRYGSSEDSYKNHGRKFRNFTNITQIE